MRGPTYFAVDHAMRPIHQDRTLMCLLECCLSYAPMPAGHRGSGLFICGRLIRDERTQTMHHTLMRVRRIWMHSIWHKKRDLLSYRHLPRASNRTSGGLSTISSKMKKGNVQAHTFRFPRNPCLAYRRRATTHSQIHMDLNACS